MFLVWMLSSISLQCHKEEVQVMGLVEQLKSLQERQVCKTLMSSRSLHKDNFTSGLL
jgi:hypothetical protein